MLFHLHPTTDPTDANWHSKFKGEKNLAREMKSLAQCQILTDVGARIEIWAFLSPKSCSHTKKQYILCFQQVQM